MRTNNFWSTLALTPTCHNSVDREKLPALQPPLHRCVAVAYLHSESAKITHDCNAGGDVFLDSSGWFYWMDMRREDVVQLSASSYPTGYKFFPAQIWYEALVIFLSGILGGWCCNLKKSVICPNVGNNAPDVWTLRGEGPSRRRRDNA